MSHIRIRSAFGRAVLLATVVWLAPAISFAGDVKFRTASGDIGCMASGSPPAGLRCDIAGGVKPVPPAPKDCQLDWGEGFELAATGTASVTCAGDTMLDSQARVIPSGTSWKQGALACSSQTSSLRCVNTVGHGFFLSKEHSYRF
jgi:hypothetical protein